MSLSTAASILFKPTFLCLQVDLKRIDVAVDAMRPLGFPKTLVCKIVNKLLKVSPPYLAKILINTLTNNFFLFLYFQHPLRDEIHGGNSRRDNWRLMFILYFSCNKMFFCQCLGIYVGCLEYPTSILVCINVGYSRHPTSIPWTIDVGCLYVRRLRIDVVRIHVG